MITLEVVLASVMREPEVAFRLKEACSSDLVVANPFHRQVMEFLSAFMDKHGSLPKPGDYEAWLTTLPDRQQQGVRLSLGQLQQQDTSAYTPEYLAEYAIGELKAVATHTALERMNAMGGAMDADTLLTMSDRVREVSALGIEGLADLRDVDTYARQEREDRGIPTGIPTLDNMIHGFREELVFIMADSGVGKTTALINFGQAAALHGAHVLHLTLELSTKNAINRYYRRISESTRGEYYANIEFVRTGLKSWWRLAKGSVHVLYKPAYAVTPENLQSLLRLYTRQYREIDMVIIDYLDLLAPSPNFHSRSSYEQLGYVTHLVRGFCDEFGAAVLSATQATRPTGRERRRLRLSDMGDSYKKVQGADVILGLVQTEEEAEVCQARMGALKMRESPGRGQEIALYLNLDVMAMLDLHHPDTARLQDRFGHPLEVPEADDDE